MVGIVVHNQQSKPSPTSDNPQYVKYALHFQIFSKFFRVPLKFFLKDAVH